jgi:hypothetical protein
MSRIVYTMNRQMTGSQLNELKRCMRTIGKGNIQLRTEDVLFASRLL